MRRLIVIGTRGSDLALWQANNLKKRLKEEGHLAELKIIKTKGDRIQDIGFDKMEGKGFFTKEIEDALLEKKTDIAVHSLKDLSTTQPEGLTICGLSDREDPRDLLIIRKDIYQPDQLLGLPESAIVGTSSIRRKVQIKSMLPHVQLKDLRGNVPTRLDKLRGGSHDAIIIASAGVKRLGITLDEFETHPFNPKEFVPAPGQGVVAYQCREEDKELRKIIGKIHAREVNERVRVERGVLRHLGGGCQVPLGVYCEKDKAGNFHVHAAYGESLLKPLRKINVSQSTTHMLAERVIEKLLK